MPATLTIHPWPDPVIDTLGYDPRSRYVETFWLPTLGPTVLLLLRHLADRFDRQPGGIELPVSDTRTRSASASATGRARRSSAPWPGSRSSTSRAATAPPPSRSGATSRRSTAVT